VTKNKQVVEKTEARGLQSFIKKKKRVKVKKPYYEKN